MPRVPTWHTRRCTHVSFGLLWLNGSAQIRHGQSSSSLSLSFILGFLHGCVFLFLVLRDFDFAFDWDLFPCLDNFSAKVALFGVDVRCCADSDFRVLALFVVLLGGGEILSIRSRAATEKTTREEQGSLQCHPITNNRGLQMLRRTTFSLPPADL